MRFLAWLLLTVLIAALAVGAFYFKIQTDALTGQLTQCHAESDEHKAKVTERDAKLAETSTERDREKTAHADCDYVVAAVQANLSTTRGELAELRRLRNDAELRLAVFNGTTSKLQKLTDTGKLKVLMRDG